MGKCLVTKLNGAVDNSNLLKIGELRIKIVSAPNPSKFTQGMSLQFTEPTEVSIVGDGYFTDENLSANYGKVKTITNERFFISNGNYELSIKNKYKVSLLSSVNRNTNGNNIGYYKSIDINELKYSNSLTWIDAFNPEGDISAFKNALNLVFVGFSSTNVTGDISAFSNNTALANLYLDSTNVTGDISAFSNNTALTSIKINNTNVTGDISAFKNMTKLKTLNVNYTSVYGDIGSFRNCNLSIINISNVGNLTGDFAKLPAKCYYIALAENASKNVFNWTRRDISEYITTWTGYAKVTNVDDMLIGMANCTAHPDIATFPTWQKTINIVGTRTSASDSALATLQQKGYTVSVTSA